MKSDAPKILIQELELFSTYKNIKTSIVEKNYGTFCKQSWIFTVSSLPSAFEY